MLEHALPWEVVLLRLGLAAMAGAIVGLERESHGRAAGLRTTMLVCVSAAVAMLVSHALFVASTGPGISWRPDPARLAAGILTGMGFLGGGAIIREGNMVRGVTTAAALWFVTVLGLAFGSGLLGLGLCGLGLAVVILLILSRAENHLPRDWYGSVTLVLSLDGAAIDEIRTHLESRGVVIKKMDLDYDLQQSRRTITLGIKYKRGDIFALSRSIIDDLVRCPGVLQVRWC